MAGETVVTGRLFRRPRAVDPPVLLIVAAALALVVSYRRFSVAPSETVHGLDGQLEVWLPRGWNYAEQDGVFVASPPSLGAFVPTLTVRPIEVPEGASTAAFLDLQMAIVDQARAESGVGYRVLETADKVAFGGHKSFWSHYAIVRDPPDAAPGAAVLPVVLAGVDILVLANKRRVYHVSAWAPAEQFVDPDDELQATLESLRFSR